MNNHYDVCILGGGLAGLTLSIQLKQANPNISIKVIEMRKGDAPDAAHKVGESTVELGTYYLREVLDLKEYLEKHELPKQGLRFFFTPQHKDDISKRVEFGPKNPLPVPSHQLDRGTFENELARRAASYGADVVFESKVKNVDLHEDKHSVTYTTNRVDTTITARWVVDASGRASFLKRKLGLMKELEHNINTAWFRVKGEIDIADWSDNKEWVDAVRPGLRRLGTIHFMDKGYWLWFIPLGSGNTSVGIVADPRYRPFEEFNTYEKAMDWIKTNEPIAYKCLDQKRDDVLDFKTLTHYAHHTKKLYSTDRWAVVGDAGAFLDPFYSPGTDFISITNTFVSDLILRDKNEEDVFLRTNVYEQSHFALFNNWVPVYNDKYQLYGLTQTMILKIYWDWAVYWAVPTLLFTNRGFTDISVLKELFSSADKIGQKFGALNAKMQQIFIDWSSHDTATFTNRYMDLFDSKLLATLHKGIEERHTPQNLIKQVTENVALLEKMAAQIFRLFSTQIYGTSEDLKVNPYQMNILEKPMDAADGLPSDQIIKEDVKLMWLY